MSSKRRPLRVFYDSKGKKFYIYNKGRKSYLKIPKEIDTLEKAQEFISKKLAVDVKVVSDRSVNYKSEVKSIKSDPANSHFSTELPLSDDEFYELYKTYITHKSPNTLNINEATIRKAKVVYEAKEKAKDEARRAEKALARLQEAKDRAQELAQLAQLSNDNAQQAALLNDLKDEEKKLAQELKNSAADAKIASQDQKQILETIADEGKQGKQFLEQIKSEFKTTNDLNQQIIDQQTRLITYIINQQQSLQAKQIAGPSAPQSQPQPQSVPVSGVTVEDISEDKDKEYEPIDDSRSIPITTTPEDRKKTFEGRLSTFNIPIKVSEISQFKKWNTSDAKLDYLFRVASFLTNPNNSQWVYDHFPGLYPFFSGPQTGPFIPNDVNRGIYILKNISPEDYNSYVGTGKFPPEFKSYPLIPVNEGSKSKPKIVMKIGEGNNLPALWDSQIDEFFEDEPRFGGVICSDEIDKLPNKLPIGFVMNLDKSTGKGTHWVSCYMSPESLEYFDPLGDPPSPDFVKRMKKKIKHMQIPNMLKFKINEVAQQNGNSKHCGYHAIRFLDDRFHGLEFPLSTRYYGGKTNNSKEGEDVVKKEFALI